MLAKAKRIKAGVYLVHGVYVVREHFQGASLTRGYGHRTEWCWQAYKFFDDDRAIGELPGGDWATLAEAKSALVPRPGKLGTHSSATYQIIGYVGVAQGAGVLIRSDSDNRVTKWSPAVIDRINDDGFIYMSFK